MKKRIKLFFYLSFLNLLVACGGGQTTYYWYKQGIGPQWFARDHNQCLAEADYWPWTLPAWPPGTEPLPKLRFDNDSNNGIWASVIPYPGAQPVYVNSLLDDWSMIPSVYKKCMKNKGYIERAPAQKSRQVFPE